MSSYLTLTNCCCVISKTFHIFFTVRLSVFLFLCPIVNIFACVSICLLFLFAYGTAAPDANFPGFFFYMFSVRAIPLNLSTAK